MSGRPPRMKDFPRQGPVQRGYTLIEVLLTAVIVLLAMTGMMTMQMMGIKVTQDAYNRTQATTLAYQMTDSLRANCDNIANYADTTFCDSNSRAENDSRSCDYAQDPQDGASLADSDLDTWWNNIAAAGLPPWYAGIQQDGNVFHIVIQWEDRRITEAEERLTGNNDESSGATSCTDSDIPSGMVEVCLSTIPCP